MKRLDAFIAKRRDIARRYDAAFAGWPELEPRSGRVEDSAWHLYVIRLRGKLAAKRREVFQALRKGGLGVQVHYIPVYWHPLYEKLGYRRGLCPKAESYYESEISLPIFPDLTTAQQDEVIATLRRVLG